MLVSVLLPALSRARQQASAVRCASNLRQIGLGYLMYTQDYRYFPKLSDVRTSTNVPMFFDCAWVDTWPKTTDPTPSNVLGLNPAGGIPDMTSRVCLNRYQRDINVCFADGSTRKVLLTDLRTLTWHRDWATRPFNPPLPKH